MFTYLLATIDELITALLREVLISEKTFGTVNMRLSTLLLLVGAVFVLLRNTIKEIIASVLEFVHQPILLDRGVLLVLGDWVTTDSIGSIISM